MALNHTVIAGINFLAVLLSVPVIAIGIWLSTQTDNSCVQLLQWPVLVIGIVILVVAIAGFVGAFWRMPQLLLFYLVAMFVLILVVAGLVIFIYAVTVSGSGHPATNRAYLEYRLEDYSGWLRRRVEGSHKWNRIKRCLSSTSVCAQMNQTYTSAQDFFNARISPLQSGCCKPPTGCGYTFVSPTNWISPISVITDVDCSLWSNDETALCYSCSSCKAGLLANLRREWRTADLVLVVTLVALIFVYTMGCYAYQNAKTDQLFSRYKQGYT
ncbi:protein TORNADO 2 [Canna indica]|uniref:Protein TORNADO 2 n=1 Tax=Canna indica TaxID=4628 RepID=A0AAQ3L5D4_9LILI|nr:protein TORNADO 2 [Canna indica]